MNEITPVLTKAEQNSPAIYGSKIVCPNCGKIKIVRGYTAGPLCYRCMGKNRRADGGFKCSDGYLATRIDVDNPFYRMAQSGGRILMQRLVMAEHLGRCLEAWEVVHHKNGNKQDNRIENLELFNDVAHMQLTYCEQEIKKLRMENQKLKTEIRKLTAQLGVK